MQFSFNIEAVAGRLPALGTTKNFLSWARGDVTLDKGAKPDRAQFLPMMTARRMCAGSRMAADTGLELLKAG
ncbi:MAG TPA: beta-ketoacyl synthase, partial [Succinivibrionaceae bacterium]|nr:beta-ketoacyl synthase [Succinivibrionaceae bacterium]